MKFVLNDGGRAASGRKGVAGDCVCRAIAIAAELPYEQVYSALANGAGMERKSKGKSARNGIHTTRKWFKDYMKSIGFEWIATMGIGTGCKVHLVDGELPMGRLVVSLSKHYCAVIDGVIHDLYNPQREVNWIRPDDGSELKAGEWRNVNGICSVQRRCVYGYWKKVTS